MLKGAFFRSNLATRRSLVEENIAHSRLLGITDGWWWELRTLVSRSYCSLAAANKYVFLIFRLYFCVIRLKKKHALTAAEYLTLKLSSRVMASLTAQT